jgi:hypothetical protein
MDRLLPKDEPLALISRPDAAAANGGCDRLFSREMAIVDATIESQTVSYSEEQVGDSRRWLALPVLLTLTFPERMRTSDP